MKKRIILGLAALLTLGILGVAVYFLFFKKDARELIYERLANNTLAAEAYKTAVTDTDADGLMDWEESLWKTDLKNADTDKDTYKDGEETRLGYDPLDSSSNPKTEKKTINNPLSETIYSKEELRNLNLTQNFAAAMSSYIKDPSGLANASEDNPFTLLDEKTGTGLLNFVSELRPTINSKEIKTTNDNSKESARKYIGQIKNIIPKNLYEEESEEEIFRQAMENNDFQKIKEYAAYFGQIADGLKKMEAPSDFFSFHKREIELILSLQKIYESIGKINTDPLKTVLALQEFLKTRKELWNLMDDFLILYESKL